MNKHKFLIIGLSLALFAVSCKKNDTQASKEAATNTSTQTEWKQGSSWTSSKDDKVTTYSTSITDKNITADVVEKGLVLAYLKDGSDVYSLPYEQSGDIATNWYYQVSENTIDISADVSSDNASLENKQSFNYIVITSSKLKSLEEKGHSINELMTLTYENAKNLLK